jgi:hypothetical protein
MTSHFDYHYGVVELADVREGFDENIFALEHSGAKMGVAGIKTYS